MPISIVLCNFIINSPIPAENLGSALKKMAELPQIDAKIVKLLQYNESIITGAMKLHQIKTMETE